MLCTQKEKRKKHRRLAKPFVSYIGPPIDPRDHSGSKKRPKKLPTIKPHLEKFKTLAKSKDFKPIQYPRKLEIQTRLSHGGDLMSSSDAMMSSFHQRSKTETGHYSKTPVAPQIMQFSRDSARGHIRISKFLEDRFSRLSINSKDSSRRSNRLPNFKKPINMRNMAYGTGYR